MNEEIVSINRTKKDKSCFSCLKNTINKCVSSNKKSSKVFYIDKWRKYLSKESHLISEKNDPFELLTNLWAHKNVINELENIRLNPNLLSKNNIRNDLEFYIPQLCSFILFGDYESVQELFSFLCKSCHASFSFAHRIIWFLKSSINDDNEANNKIKIMLHIIQTIFKSDRQKDELESLYLSGSSDYIDYLNQNNLQNIYFDSNFNYYFGIQNTEINNDSKEHNDDILINEFIEKKNNFKLNLYKYTEYNYKKEIEKLKPDGNADTVQDTENNIQSNSNNNIKDHNNQSNQNDQKILNVQSNPDEIITTKNDIENYKKINFDPREIYLNLFQSQDALKENYFKQIDIDDVNLSSFLSNINFIDKLTEISNNLISTPILERKKKLINEINHLNKILPSNVYMPFTFNQIRNYVIASIPISEIKIFNTKLRCPYMITLECFRLDELNYYLFNDVILKSPRDIDSQLQLGQTYFSSPKKLNKSEKFVNYNEDSNVNLNNINMFSSENAKQNSFTNPFYKNIKKYTAIRKYSSSEKKKNTINIEAPNDIGLPDINDISINEEISNVNNKKISKNLISYLKDNDKKFSDSIIINLKAKNENREIQRTRSMPRYMRRNKKYKKIKDKEPNNQLTIMNSLDTITTNQNNYISQLNKYDDIDNQVKSSFLTSRKDIDLSNEIDSTVLPRDIISNDLENENEINCKQRKNNTERSFISTSSIEQGEISSESEQEQPKDIKQGKDIIENIKINSNQIKKLNNSTLSSSKNSPFKRSKNSRSNSSNSGNSGNESDSKSEEEDDTEDERNNSSSDLDNLEILSSTQSSLFGEQIEETTQRLKKDSPFGSLYTYKIFKVIIKSGEDLRQEQFATQLINEFNQIFKIEGVKCWVKPYEIISTGVNVGIVEVVNNSLSLDQLKKQTKGSLNEFFINHFGPVNSKKYKIAIKNYISSLAGYSLVCYFLQIKDRHNANILIDNQGHLIHIDFGFMLSNAPGKGLKFEKAPFKLTNEFVEVMGGTNSNYFSNFRKLLWKGFVALVNHYEKILILVEMMFCGHGNKLPCFQGGQSTIDELKMRFVPRPGMKKRDYIEHVDYLISQSLDNWRTNWYDKFQYFFQGIIP